MAAWDYCVEPVGDGRWQVRRSDREKPDAFYATRNAAISAARVIAQLMGSAVALGGEDGSTIRTDYRGRELAA